MIGDELSLRIQELFSHEPTAGQHSAMDTFCRFLMDRGDRPTMVMCGSAGTGKTSLTAAFVRALVSMGQRVVLLAPTGRAAKVLSLNAGMPAYTIHRWIYRQKTFTGDMTGFNLNFNKHRDTLFIVDEASMIANGSQSGDIGFGSGRLLDDLVQFVYSGDNCRLMLVGDKAQLPPVGEEESPALMPEVLRGRYGLGVHAVEITEVLRQSAQSGILYNANIVRQMITHDEMTQLPVITFSGFADIHIVRGDELIEQLAGSYSAVGTDETMVVTRSNKRANIYNRGIRGMVLGKEEELSQGDLIMVVRNNYYWTEQERAKIKAAAQQNGADGAQATSVGTQAIQSGAASAETVPLSFIANGDRACVRRVSRVRDMYGLRFADLTVEFPDYDNYEMLVTAVLTSLSSESPSLTREQSEQLFNGVMDDYADLPMKADRLRQVRTDQYYNALQIKYAYAVTCHKAQGGQWAHVYVDQGYMTDDMLTPDYIHWLYTAFTRATEHLYLVNWPKEQTGQ